jgi:hypothetical protein
VRGEVPEQVFPLAGLHAGLVVAPHRRGTFGYRQVRGLGGVNVEIDAMLMQRIDLVGGDEASALVGRDDDPVKDVLMECSNDMVDRADDLAAAIGRPSSMTPA